MVQSSRAIVVGTAEEGTVVLATRALIRHYSLFLKVMCVTLALALGSALVIKKQYRSEMKFLVQNARSTAVISSDHANSSIVNGVTEEQLNSELAILQSEDVLGKVADPEWKPEDASKSSVHDSRAHGRKVTRLTSRLNVDPVGKLDVMSLSYVDDSPQKATEVLTSLAKTYLARHEQLRRPVGASSFYDEQVRHYESVWTQAAQDLVEFQQAHHMVSVPEVEESIQHSLLTDQDALRNYSSKLQGSNAAIRKANDLLATAAPRQQTQQRVIPSEMLIQQLKTSLVGLTNHRTELLNRYQPTDRLVTEIDVQIADTTKALAAESQNLSVENTSDVNPSWQQLKTSLVEEQVNNVTLQGGQAGLTREIAELKSQLTDAQNLELTFDRYRAQAQEADANYKAFVEKRDLARVEDAMDRSNLLNVVVMESPTFSPVPARPKPMLNLLLGIPTAIFVAAAAVYFAETSRKTIGSPEELGGVTDYPLLATFGLDPALQG